MKWLAGPGGEPRPREALHPAEAVRGDGTALDVRAHLVGRRLLALRRRRPPLLHLLDLARHRPGEHASGELVRGGTVLPKRLRVHAMIDAGGLHHGHLRRKEERG